MSEERAVKMLKGLMSRKILLAAFLLSCFTIDAQTYMAPGTSRDETEQRHDNSPADAGAPYLKSKSLVFAPLSRTVTYEYDRIFQKEEDARQHSNIKPFLLESKLTKRPLSLEMENDSASLEGKLFARHLIHGRDRGPNFDPLFTIMPGYDLRSRSNTMRLEAGVRVTQTVRGRLSKRDAFYYNASYLGGLSTFPSYLDSIIDSLNMIPGLGRAYGSPKKYSYQQFAGYLSYSPNDVFNFQAGQDKNFWGDGYRSLFISDAADNYPFLKITSTLWKLKYVNLYARFRDFGPTARKEDIMPKYGTFHYLSFNATKWLNLSLFEAIIWQGSDTNRTRNFDINYLNPVIFFRPVEYSLGSSDNALVGGSIKVKIKGAQMYGQLLLDEFLLRELRNNRGWWGNKHGLQAGIKLFDLFRIKHLYLQAEYNTVRPYTYTHGTVRQSYTHLSQPLAHLLGANFREAVAFLGYRYKRMLMEGKLLYADYGIDSANTNYGHNLLLSYATRPGEYGHYTGQGVAAKLAVADLRVAYVINTVYNLIGEARLSTRIARSAFEDKTYPFVQLGFRTDLANFYDDF
jgi:hypothetical protein